MSLKTMRRRLPRKRLSSELFSNKDTFHTEFLGKFLAGLLSKHSASKEEREKRCTVGPSQPCLEPPCDWFIISHTLIKVLAPGEVYRHLNQL
jgi:hypothetical protein